MAQVDNLRNGLIERLQSISNVDYLEALNELVGGCKLQKSEVPLTEEQILMRVLSEDDIEQGRVIPQDQLDKADCLWLKRLWFGLQLLLSSDGKF